MADVSTIKKAIRVLREDGAVELGHRALPIVEDWLVGHYYTKIYDIRNSIRRQKDLIHSLVEEDEFVLIILDACRFDYFSEYYDEYLAGELSKVWSEGSRTPQWIPRTWTESYDLTYVNGAPYFSDLRSEQLAEDYTPSKHISDIQHVWATNWDERRFTPDPSKITDTALRHIASDEPTRLVIHYMQPHQPYIGDESGNFRDAPEIPVWDMSRTDLDREEVYDMNDPETRHVKRPDLPRYTVKQQIADGELDIQSWRDAYQRNLRAVLNEVRFLVKHIDPECKTVISSDHGEHLGEHSEITGRRLFMHPASRIDPVLREVPWFVIDEECLQDESIGELEESKTEAPEISMDVQKKRLADLGYI